jgi:hypothetical protein
LLAAIAGLVAWAGASLVVLADGRRGLALGMVFASAGLAALAFMSAGGLAAAAIATGGAIAAAGRLRSGVPGWQVMPPGSTPRVVLCAATGLVALWIAFTITTGPGAGLRFTALAALALATARILWSADPAAQLTAVGVLALAAGLASAVGAANPDLWPFAAAGLVAAAAAWLPVGMKKRAA